MVINPSLLLLALNSLLHLSSAAKIVSDRGAGILETYVSLFGVTGSRVEDQFDGERMGELARARLAEISSPEYKETHIVTEMSPFQVFERQTLKLRSSDSEHQITEECGRIYFSSIESLRALCKAHLESLQLRIQDFRAGNKATADDEIDVESTLDEIKPEDDSDSKKLQNWTAHLEDEKQKVHAMEAFVTAYPTPFIASSVDVHTAQGVRTVLDQKLNKKGADVFVSIIDSFEGVLPQNLSKNVVQIVPVVLSKRPDTGNHVVDIFHAIAPKIQIQACHMPLLANSGLVKTLRVPIDQSSTWMGNREILNKLSNGNREFTILFTKYTITKPLPVLGDIVQICLSEFEGKLDENYAGRISGLAHLGNAIGRAALIVNAAGDLSHYQDNGKDDLTRLVHEKVSSSFLNVVGLAQDGAHLACYSNQPGSVALGKRTLAAISHYPAIPSTSSAAAYVSGCAAVLKSLYPLLSNRQIADCLLLSATPIVLISDTKSFPFTFPLVLDGIMAKDFRAGITVSMAQRRVKVTLDVFEESRKKYGMGRINLAAAITLAQQI